MKLFKALYAWVMFDDQGHEGVLIGPRGEPLIRRTHAEAQALAKRVKAIVDAEGKEARLICFALRNDSGVVSTIRPGVAEGKETNGRTKR